MIGPHSSFALVRLICAGFAIALSFALTSCAPSAPGESRQTSIEERAPGKTLFDKSLDELRAGIDERRQGGVPVPVPADGGGGYTHEQHKQNAKTIYESGMLYQLTGEEIYRDFAASILVDYAELYPTLELHPKRRENHWPGRLFWQGLNEAWWLVYVIQGYDEIRDDLPDELQGKIETELLHPMAKFLSEGSPRTFNRIHNHATWAAASVGMTGYVLGEQEYVDRALYGLDKSGETGFLKQVDLLFSPDGYYSEGPYYQRYAMMPYLLFAQAIEKNDPDREIFDYRDSVLRKAISTTIQLSYGGKFFPINDAIREKGLNTAELRYAVAIAYDLTGDPSLLSIAKMHKSIVPTPEGKKLADAIAAGNAKPFLFQTMMFRDGPNGDHGALITLRSGPEHDAAAVVFKAASQGLGHGHFDRLGLLYFDNGDEIIADYGAARFLNVEPKNGGHYLPENKSWAKQTVAHNTLVVDQSSQFGGDWRRAEEHTPTILAFDDKKGASFAAAETDFAYDGVQYRRVLAMVDRPDGGSYVIDIVHARSEDTHTYDLPVHFKGQLIETSIPFQHATTNLAPMGENSGYQHLWKTAQAANLPQEAQSDFSFLIEEQFYTLTVSSDQGLTSYLTRLGANDPNNNLRNEQALILRANAKGASFFSVYERHGLYDNDEEVTIFSGGSVERLDIEHLADAELYTLTTTSGEKIRVLNSNSSDGSTENSITHEGETISWQGPVGLHVTSTNRENPREN